MYLFCAGVQRQFKSHIICTKASRYSSALSETKCVKSKRNIFVYLCFTDLEDKSIWQSNYKYCNKDYATFCEKTCRKYKKFATIIGSLVICAK